LLGERGGEEEDGERSGRRGEVERGPEGLRLRFDSPSEFATEIQFREFDLFLAVRSRFDGSDLTSTTVL
jgi:hypothetical protein